MRVLIAPDCFGGTLTAREAASAMAAGWRSAKPADELVLRPLADGGPGFVDVLHASLGGTVHSVSVTGPLGTPVTARWLEHDGTAYIESAEACGLHLVPAGMRPEVCETVTTRGVGELIRAAWHLDTIVVGLGGSATTDGGAGLFEILDDLEPAGASPGSSLSTTTDSSGSPAGSYPQASQPAGAPPGSSVSARSDSSGPRAKSYPQLIAASDVENPLLGPHGAARTFGPQKGASREAVERLEAKLAAMDRLKAVQDVPGAGAAGGLGAALLSLGATIESGAGLVREKTRLDDALNGADLAVTGEGSFDWQSLRGKLVTAVAQGAARKGIPCIVLAGQVSVGRREAASAGVQAAYSVSEHAGSTERSLNAPRETLEALAAHVARQWST
ncbi:glycerate kinase [Lentzea sp. NBRC 105346]|uniref:glycerate kinase family protein n=1 Tax=Lentzea sp. NBRC 105346 TaxID=3032205 RepID=UPI0024A3187F|nr:glycerate kinase [Lentzea sp. NBRC 105346]GLZ36189.1 glycerate kinase [Lentzea sp. NBRC 105346]